MIQPLFTLIDEQDDFIVISKVANCNFHDEEDLGNGLFNQVKKQLNLTDLYPVHRLDKMTSGILVFAKNKTSAALFQELFQAHQIEKYYLAISDQKPKKKQGLIKGDMVKSRRSCWKLLRTTNNPAVSQFFSFHLIKGLRLFLIKPHSGKTHQIRVALSSIGAQILGDELYSKTKSDRGYLHAYAIKFTFLNTQYQYKILPSTGEYFINTSFPEDIEEPWQLKWPKI